MEKSFYKQLKELVKEDNLKTEEPLAGHTTMRIGGPADYFVTPDTVEELKAIINLCRIEKMPYYVLGNGSNLLVGDYGYRGVMIQVLRHFNQIKFENETSVTAGSGVLLSKLAAEIAQQGLTGFEFAEGIPGTLGGAITMNAGAYGGEMKGCIEKAFVMNGEGNVYWLTRDELQLGYRTSLVQKDSLIVLEATFSFAKGDKERILDTMKEFNTRRKEKQPLEYPSVGSTFKRPEGFFAGKLIMDADLRGYRVGDMMISDKHCGFVINVGKGTAKQARTLIEDVDRIVFEKFSVHLEPEVRFLGEF